MKFQYHRNRDGTIHFEKHGVSILEIHEVFTETHFFEEKRKDSSFIAYSKLKSSRYLKIIYRKITNELYFIITAFDLEEPLIIDLIEKELEK